MCLELAQASAVLQYGSTSLLSSRFLDRFEMGHGGLELWSLDSWPVDNDDQVRMIALEAATLSMRLPSLEPLEVLDAAMRGHVLAELDFSQAGAYFKELVSAASESQSLIFPPAQPWDFLRWRFGLRPDEPARGELEWRDRCACVLQANADAFPHSDSKVRDCIESWTAALYAAHTGTESPERVAMRLVEAQRAGRVQ